MVSHAGDSQIDNPKIWVGVEIYRYVGGLVGVVWVGIKSRQVCG